jgi:outer membrane protein assembly factor BamB
VTLPRPLCYSHFVRLKKFSCSQTFYGLALLFVSTTLLRAGDWPQWRGPNRDGISTEKNWSDKWSADGPAVKWKASVGLGFSSFVIGGGRAITTGYSDNKDTVFCFDAVTGKALWKHEYPAELGDKYFEGGTTGTPTIEGNRVYQLSRWGDLFCLDAASGKVIWKRNLQADASAQLPTWGFSGAPTVFEKLLILNVGESGMAVEKETGKTVWQSSGESGYSTPLPWRQNDHWSILFGSAKSYVAVDPQTGKEQWRFRWVTEYGVNAADPVIDGANLFISSGYGKGAALIKPGAGPEPETLWKNKVLRTQQNPAVLWNGYLFGFDGNAGENASLKCISASTGEEKWSEPSLGFGAASLADGKLIVLGERGELLVAPASPSGFAPTSRAQVLGKKCWIVPVLANGLIYCRNSRGDVVCVDVGAPK